MQINRLFEIIYILLDSPVVTAKDLANRFEVSPRTIYRDIETLSVAGIPVYMTKGRNGGISLLPDFVLNKAVLTNEEKTAILSSLKAVSALDFTKNSATYNKLGNMLGSQNADWIEVHFTSWGNSKKEEKVFHLLKEAILHKQNIQFHYSSAKNEDICRTALPLKLVFKGQSWYLYAYCELRKDYRFFKLRRIHDLIVTDEHFAMQAPPLIFKQDNIFEGQMLKAKFRVAPQMAYRIFDEITIYEKDTKGYFIFEEEFPNLDSICGYAGSFGEFCEILTPKEARDEMKRRLNAMLEKLNK